jgi:lipoate-protein ligase A
VSLPTFAFVSVHPEALADGIAREAEWLAGCAASKRALAHLWHGPSGFIVPRRYALLPGWASLGREHAAAVQVRASGGGLVPQGPGVWNLSLMWPAASATPSATDAIYRALCGELAAALARLGIRAAAQAVKGSFCDGRYNLAVGGRKLVGTAQAWRRVAGQPVVLAHAVIIVAADPVSLTERANAFEAALGTVTRYRADAVTSVAEAAASDDNRIEGQTLRVVAEQFAHLLVPHVTPETDHGPA